MKALLVLFLFLVSAFGAHASNLDTPSLDPSNKEYIQDFCNYHPTSPICVYKPNPKPRPAPTPPLGSGDMGGGSIVAPPPPPPAVCRGSGKSTTVGSAAQFQAALDGASGGDTIVLAPGTYGTLNLNKGGSGASTPIYITAQNPAVNTSAQPQSAPRSSVGLMVVTASNITVCGIFFNDTSWKSLRHDKRADNIVYLQNYFNTGIQNQMGVEQAIDTLKGGTNFTLQSNYFNATRNPVYALDYGLLLYNYNGVYVRGNVFDGVFNHAVSLKNSDNNVFIDGNVFRGCGQVCIEIGQVQDFRGEYNNTGMNATITNNIVIEAYTNHPQSKYRKAVLLRNQQNIVFRGNTLQGVWDQTITTDFINRGGLAKQAGRELGIWGLKQTSILIEGNKFNNAKLQFTGRGTGKTDTIILKDNTGSFHCQVGPMQKAEGKKYVDSTIDTAAPTVIGCK